MNAFCHRIMKGETFSLLGLEKNEGVDIIRKGNAELTFK